MIINPAFYARKKHACKRMYLTTMLDIYSHQEPLLSGVLLITGLLITGLLITGEMVRADTNAAT